MTFPRARLAVAASLFVAWLGYLLLLVVGSRHTIVLSRPQFLIANLWVLAEVEDDEGKPARAVKILEVFLPKESGLQGKTIETANLADAGRQGYIGPGKYILPLHAGPSYSVEPVPPSPGYEPAFVNVRLFAPVGDAQDAALAAREIFGLSEPDARAKMMVAEKNGSVVLARNVPFERFREFAKRLPDADAKPQANDVRIYPMTAETKAQLEEMLRARKP
jgi:hypothetical protein